MIDTRYLLYSVGAILAIKYIMPSLKWLSKYMRLLVEINKVDSVFDDKHMIPFIGNAHQLEGGSGFYKIIQSGVLRAKDKSILRLWIGTQPILLFTKAESIEFLVNSSKHIDKANEYEFFHPWLGTGLLTSTGEKWFKRRRLITPSFHFEILNKFLIVMSEQADIFVSVLRKHAKSGKEFDICPLISNCALDIICETAMGQNVNAQNDNDSEYVKAVIKISELIFTRTYSPWLASDFIFYRTQKGIEFKKCLKIVQDFTRKVIQERSAEFDHTEFADKNKIAFLDNLLKCKLEDSTITFDDIQEEVDTFMFEGHDTTAAATSWACYLIGSHPEVQDRIYDEIQRVFENSNRPATAEDLKELRYLECVIKETLRLYPSVAFFGRTLTEDAVCEGKSLPKGCTALIMAFAVHRDEKYFPEPEKFQPERFLIDENATHRHPYAYIPFSAGKRNCVGQKFALMEEKVVLLNIVRNFKISMTQTVNELEPDFELILRPRNGIRVMLEERV